jgi:hypothetical protein
MNVNPIETDGIPANLGPLERRRRLRRLGQNEEWNLLD